MENFFTPIYNCLQYNNDIIKQFNVIIFILKLLYQALAEGLRTGETEWLEPMETQSAVDLTRALIEGKYSEFNLCDMNTQLQKEAANRYECC